MMKATVVTFPDEFARQEILELAKAAGYTVLDVMTQKVIIRSEFGVGVGKAQELAEIVAKNHSETVIIDDTLTSSQANNLATETHAEVIDRERLILNIFALRATTTEAKLQVQLAELRYELPRAKDVVRHSASGERAGYMGTGELAIDVKFRALKKRMVALKEKLARAQTNKTLQRTERKKLHVPFVSFAGYTSSGKTTLFNRLASESKEESKNLFTTLATTTRLVKFPGAKKGVLLSDTVGFISRLPTYLVESFKSTLNELTYADLILLVLDASEDPDSLRIKLGSCGEVLDQLKVDKGKILLVLNKIDQGTPGLGDLAATGLLEGLPYVKTSATRGDGMHQLRNRIREIAKV